MIRVLYTGLILPHVMFVLLQVQAISPRLEFYQIQLRLQRYYLLHRFRPLTTMAKGAKIERERIFFQL